MSYLEAFILALIEGITEFLPVSSTGHMIIGSAILGIESTEFVKTYTVAIQLGAILSVVVLYYKRFLKNVDFYFKLAISVVPTLVLGFLLNDFIDSLLENVWVVAICLILGGIILLFVDKWFANNTDESDTITYKKGIIVGFFQSLAMIPGVSRSAAATIGGMLQGWTRKKAAEFSFFLAVPTMCAATGYKLLKTYKNIQTEDISLLIFGNFVAFVVAMIAIKFFISVLTKYGFRWFGWYRICIGVIILIFLFLGYDLKIA